MDDLVRARHVPSPQLIGTPERATIDLGTLQSEGVRIVGRLAAVRDGVAQFSGSLTNVCKLADLKLERLLDAFDTWALAARVDGDVGPPQRLAATPVPRSPLTLDLHRGEIGTIIWACGYRPDQSWLHVPAFDRSGRLRHDGGVVCDAPGVYLLGAPFLRRCRSSFINGASSDSADVADHLHRYLDRRATRRPQPVAACLPARQAPDWCHR